VGDFCYWGKSCGGEIMCGGCGGVMWFGEWPMVMIGRGALGRGKKRASRVNFIRVGSAGSTRVLVDILSIVEDFE